jgi:hypothetical protein
MDESGRSVSHWKYTCHGNAVLEAWRRCLSLQVRQAERRAPVAAEIRAEKGEERLPLVDRQMLSRTRHPAPGHEGVWKQLRNTPLGSPMTARKTVSARDILVSFHATDKPFLIASPAV